MTGAEPALVISADLSLPLEAVTETFAVLAKRGTGKSNAAVVMAEEMYDHGLPWVAIDPKGDWWGVRAAGDGETPGLAVLVFGGQHGDVPLEPTAGRLVADLVVEQRLTCVLDVSEMTKADQRRFLTDFADRLYRRNTEPLHVFCEEADEYIPQRVMGEVARLVGAFETLIKRGRTHGIGVTLITQRSASLNKDVLTQVETLMVLRTPSPQDRKAILGWVDVHAAGADAVDQLPGLATGEAYVFSPQWLGILQRIMFRRRRTFDSGATPKVGGQPVRPPARLAEVDLAAIKEAMAATIEKAEADDPKRLHARIRELERQLAGRAPSAELHQALARVGILEGVLAGLGASLSETSRRLAGYAAMLGQHVEIELPAAAKEGGAVVPDTPGAIVAPGTANTEKNEGSPAGSAVGGPAGAPVTGEFPLVKPAQRSYPVAPDGTVQAESVKLGRTERRILAVLAQHGPRTHRQMALQTGYSAKASTIGVGMARLRKLEYAEPGQPYTATDAGLAALAAHGGYEPLPTGPALLDYWRAQLGKTENAVLDALLAAYPDVLRQTEIAERTGYSPTASTIGVALSKLRRLELVDGWGISDDFARSIR